MKKYILILCIVLLSCSCVAQKKKVISKSTIKLEEKNTTIRNLLDIDGYYQMQISTNRHPENTSDLNFMFFENGIYTYNFFFKKGTTESQTQKNMSNCIDWIDKEQTRWGAYWGTYRIEGDTIIAHSFLKGNLTREWIFYEKRYKILDRTTFKIIYSQSLLRESPHQKDPWDLKLNYSLSRFIPADSLPSSNCWLKEEKWIWQNESDWKNYMEKIKQK